jgi:hypothetical protein
MMKEPTHTQVTASPKEDSMRIKSAVTTGQAPQAVAIDTGLPERIRDGVDAKEIRRRRHHMDPLDDTVNTELMDASDKLAEDPATFGGLEALANGHAHPSSREFSYSEGGKTCSIKTMPFALPSPPKGHAQSSRKMHNALGFAASNMLFDRPDWYCRALSNTIGARSHDQRNRVMYPAAGGQRWISRGGRICYPEAEVVNSAMRSKLKGVKGTDILNTYPSIMFCYPTGIPGLPTPSTSNTGTRIPALTPTPSCHLATTRSNTPPSRCRTSGTWTPRMRR